MRELMEKIFFSGEFVHPNFNLEKIIQQHIKEKHLVVDASQNLRPSMREGKSEGDQILFEDENLTIIPIEILPLSDIQYLNH